MVQLIRINQEEKAPRIICPKCHAEIYMDISHWNQDCTKIMEDKCPKCRGTIFAGLLILCHPELRGLLECIKICSTALAGSSQILGSKRQ